MSAASGGTKRRDPHRFRRGATAALLAGSLACMLLFADSLLSRSFAQEAPTPPVTTISPDSAWRSEPVSVTLHASDADGVAQTRYSTDDWATSQVYGGAFTVAEEGVTGIRFYSVDTLGAREDTRTAEIRLDFTPPVVDPFIADDMVNGVWRSWFGADATDSLSGVAQVFVSIDAGPWVPYDAPKPIEELAGHTVAFYAVDVAGNASEPDVTTFADHDSGDDTGDPGDGFPGSESTSNKPASAIRSSSTSQDEAYLPYTETDEPYLPYTGTDPSILLLAAAALLAGLAVRVRLA